MSEIIELTLGFVPERDAAGKVYALLINMLQSVEKDCGAGLLFICYKLKFLEIVGFLPALNGCGRCGSDGSAFYLSHGTVLCGRCSSGHEKSFSLSPAVVRLCQSLLEWDFSKVHRIKPSDVLASELSRLLDEHVRYIMERNLRTKAFRIFGSKQTQADCR
jgi:DNA repair protein RecO (recombination protein O)